VRIPVIMVACQKVLTGYQTFRDLHISLKLRFLSGEVHHITKDQHTIRLFLIGHLYNMSQPALRSLKFRRKVAYLSAFSSPVILFGAGTELRIGPQAYGEILRRDIELGKVPVKFPERGNGLLTCLCKNPHRADCRCCTG